MADAHKDTISSKDSGVLWLLGRPVFKNNTYYYYIGDDYSDYSV